MASALLAAVRCDQGDVDSLLREVERALSAEGRHVQGVLQTQGLSNGECFCADMDLQVIGADRSFRISQSLGPGSRGCRLNSGALADCAAFLEQALTAETELLILNRFGRGESEGKGFRDLIGAAIAAGVPVLTALRPAYAEAWTAFGAEMACELPLEKEAVLAWFHEMQGLRACA